MQKPILFIWSLLIICYLHVRTVSAVYGVDISQAASVSTFQCLKNNGYHFAIVRCFQSTGHIDPNCVNSVKNAWAGGMSHVDVYLFPSMHHVGNGSQSVVDTANHLRQNGAHFGMLWLDIEGVQYWSGDHGANQRYFQSLVQGFGAAGVHGGIYASASQWNAIFGAGYQGGAGYPLWYPHYDGSASFSDFRPFGPFHSPAIKQFEGDRTVCGMGIDKNWYPG